MVNGAKHVFIEANGKMQKTNIRFRDNQQLMNICQRIVSQVGRRVDEAAELDEAGNPVEIAKRLDQHIGKVELILALRAN